MAISDLPGYIQGYVFSDAEQYYNSTDEYFIDQAGYAGFGEPSRAYVRTGTPQFVDVNSARGIELDNTWQIELFIPMVWYGSCIAVWGAPGFTPSGTENLSLLKGNATTTFSANQQINLGYFSGQYNRRIAVASALSTAQLNPGDSAIYAHAYALDQRIAQKRVEIMDAAGTIANGATIADNEIGYPMAGGSQSYDPWKQIIGALTADHTNTTVLASGNTLTLCELHFFSGLLTNGDTTAVEAELTALEAIYG